MTSLETFHVPKPRYEGQDHGTAGTRKGHDRNKFEEDWDNRAYVRHEAFVNSEAIVEGYDEYFDLTHEQLEEWADEILDSGDSSIFTVEQWKEKQENDFRLKLEEYKKLYDLHLELAIQLASDPTNVELAALKEKIGNQAQQLEDSFGPQSWSDTTPPTINEMGRKTQKQLNKALIESATNQYNSDDEVLDYDGNSHIRITTKSPFDK